MPTRDPKTIEGKNENDADVPALAAHKGGYALTPPLLAALLFVCAGCMPPAHNSDTFSELGVSNPLYKNLTVALVVSERGDGAPSDRARTVLIEEVSEVFTKNFKSVVKVSDAARAKAAHADLIALLDLKVRDRGGLYVDAEAKLMSPEYKAIATIHSRLHRGADTGLTLPDVVAEAAQSLDAELQGCAKLWDFASERPLDVAVAAASADSSDLQAAPEASRTASLEQDAKQAPRWTQPGPAGVGPALTSAR